MTNDKQAPAERMTAVLEAERAALLDGDLARLAALADEKAGAIAFLEQAGQELSPGVRASLAATAKRNQRLLAASAEGVRSALDRLGQMQQVRSGGGTYGPDGTRAELREPAARHERRA